MTLAGVYSRSRDRAELFAKEFNIELVCDSIDQLFEATHAHLVINCVIETAISDLSLKCLRFPWTILIEKPPGLDLAEAERLNTQVLNCGRKVFVAMNRQSYSATQELRRQISTNDGPRFIYVQDQEDPESAYRAGKPQRSIERWMFANSIHLVDYFRLLARGSARQIDIIQPWRPHEPCVLLARIEFSSGDIGFYHGVWGSPGPWAVSVTTPGLQWELRPLEQGTAQRLGEKPVPLPVHPWDTMFKPGFRYQAEQAVRAALNQPADLATLGDVMPTMKLIHQLYFPS